jgi:hypothetical protein
MLSAEHCQGYFKNMCSALRNRVKHLMAQKNPAAVQLGRKGGKAAAKNRTPQERKEHARKAAQARWAKEQKNKSQ